MQESELKSIEEWKQSARNALADTIEGNAETERERRFAKITLKIIAHIKEQQNKVYCIEGTRCCSTSEPCQHHAKDTIAEQAKEIERLKKGQSVDHVTIHGQIFCGNCNSKMDSVYGPCLFCELGD